MMKVRISFERHSIDAVLFDTPTAAGPVNFFGKLVECNIPLLDSIGYGEHIRVEALP